METGTNHANEQNEISCRYGIALLFIENTYVYPLADLEKIVPAAIISIPQQMKWGEVI